MSDQQTIAHLQQRFDEAQVKLAIARQTGDMVQIAHASEWHEAAYFDLYYSRHPDERPDDDFPT